MAERVETIIVGGGQAGLAISYCLKQLGRESLVLEKADRPGSAWLQRWESFTLLTPNWSIRLPGGEYDGPAPDGFMSREEILAYLANYASRHKLPVRYGVEVAGILPTESGFRVDAKEAIFEAANVVVATGSFQRPRIPVFASSLSSDILQLHSGPYRNPESLPPGEVLIVGSAQSGCQIAEELYQSGRKVYLSVGTAGRLPRRYRGQDIFAWLTTIGFFDRTLDKLPSPRARFAGNPQLSGKGGGHDINLHQFVRDGVMLLGRVQGATGNLIQIAPDLKESLGKVDKLEADITKMIDGYIEKNGLDIPPQPLPQLDDGYKVDLITELDLKAANVTTVIWACGYSADYSLVHLPVFDADGLPIQQQGVTQYPGLYFLGLHWLHKAKSTLLLGVGEDALHIAEHIAGRS
jgi:putative flavoprotein involved in K+ transport